MYFGRGLKSFSVWKKETKTACDFTDEREEEWQDEELFGGEN